ncbi:hypothetical protein Tco_0509712 [Tanacetum coccineum]
MASPQSSSTNISKKPIITVKPIWKKPILIDLTQEYDDVKTPSPTSMPHSPTPSNAPLKTPSTRGTSSSSSIPSRPNSSPFHSSQPINLYIKDLMDTPPRVAHPLPTQTHQPMDITPSLLPIRPLDYVFSSPSLSSTKLS